MKNLKLLLIFCSILLVSCGYEKLNSKKINNFKIAKLEIKGDERIVYKIRNNIKIFSSQNSPNIYGLEINLISVKETKIKNTAGQATRYTTKLQAETLITHLNTQNNYNKTFSSANDYDVGTNHSDTIKNEKKAVQNNLDYISNEIIKYLKLLNIK